MFISASLENEYLLIPGSKEFRPFFRVFDQAVNQTDQGYTLAAYDQVPAYQIQDQEYFGKVADITRSYDNRQQFLTGLQLAATIGDGSIIDASKGVRMPIGTSTTARQTGIIINHIPQLLQLYQGDKVLTGFSGDYDFKVKLFKGQANFVLISELWNS